MCIGGGSPNIPAPIKYAQVKTPTQGSSTNVNQDEQRRRRAAASSVNVTSSRGLQSQAALAYKTALGQ